MAKFTLDDTAPHYAEGSDTNHFLGLCEECDVHYISSRTAGEAEDWYRQGMISQDLFEAYMHGWATSAVHGAWADPWREVPENPRVLKLVALLRKVAAERKAAR